MDPLVRQCREPVVDHHATAHEQACRLGQRRRRPCPCCEDEKVCIQQVSGVQQQTLIGELDRPGLRIHLTPEGLEATTKYLCGGLADVRRQQMWRCLHQVDLKTSHP